MHQKNCNKNKNKSELNTILAKHLHSIFNLFQCQIINQNVVLTQKRTNRTHRTHAQTNINSIVVGFNNISHRLSIKSNSKKEKQYINIGPTCQK